MTGVLGELSQRHLVRTPGLFGLVAVHLVGTGPTLGRAEHDHRPGWSLRVSVGPGILLDRTDVREDPVERCRQPRPAIPVRMSGITTCEVHDETLRHCSFCQ